MSATLFRTIGLDSNCTVSTTLDSSPAQIPEIYADMKQLISLELHYNMLTGTVPDVYWQANALQLLNVGSNLLSGTISTQLGVLTQLKGFFLFRKQVSFILAVVSTFLTLDLQRSFSFGSTRFTGTIPTEIGNARFLSYHAIIR